MRIGGHRLGWITCPHGWRIQDISFMKAAETSSNWRKRWQKRGGTTSSALPSHFHRLRLSSSASSGFLLLRHCSCSKQARIDLCRSRTKCGGNLFNSNFRCVVLDMFLVWTFQYLCSIVFVLFYLCFEYYSFATRFCLQIPLFSLFSKVQGLSGKRIIRRNCFRLFVLLIHCEFLEAFCVSFLAFLD
jgi:hypothetical protein